MTAGHTLLENMTTAVTAICGSGNARACATDDDSIGNRPTFSIITVVFNALDALKVTITSVQSQEYSNIEHIVVDGGSCDGTVDYLRSMTNRLSLWISEPDKGIYDAMNKGLQLARGDYVHFLNAGDTFVDAQTLCDVAAKLDGTPTILMNRVRALDGQRVCLYPKTQGLTRVRETFLSAYCHQAAFVRREAYIAVGCFDLSYRYFADFKALWTIRGVGHVRETPLEVAVFPLDGVSSDWRLATKIALERERLLSELGDTSKAWQYQLRILRARLYTFRMSLSKRIRQCI
jgi:glycosyltransferase involved in cell wall biosynthesis